jgi:multimeric flavodoxin WrbA
MLIVGSNYWNTVHARAKEEISKDQEGLQTMRNLGLNMAWVLKNLEAGKKAGIPLPTPEPKISTSFGGK